MSQFLPLPIFPEGSLASSVVTTVWIGVMIFSIMNVRFGWAFSGLVVPGYLVPLLMVKPWAVVVIVAQAVLTFWMVRAWSDFMPRCKLACSFFGRDRFLALFLVSIVMRLVCDAWLLPSVGNWLVTTRGWEFDYKTNLHSFGLIVICLTANQFWKTGVVRGAAPFLFNLLATWAVVRWGLMEFTNFSLTNLAFLYEDIASNIAAGPKAYIVMVTTALIASRINLRYGWDFNGIMIPALLALQWYEPMKILTSVVEAVIILQLSSWAVRAPGLRGQTMEGARKMMLFFTVSFLFKIAVGHGVGWINPDAKVSDYYGFGYLLPTLMAIKMHQLNSVLRQVSMTLQVSLCAVVVANVVGFGLTFLPDAWRSAGKDLLQGEEVVVRRVSGPLETVLEKHYARVHQSRLLQEHQAPDLADLIYFEKGVDSLMKGYTRRGTQVLRAAGYEVVRVGQNHVVGFSQASGDGRCFFAINREAESNLAVECPYPLDEPGSFDAALWLFRELNARSLLVGGRPKETGKILEGDVLRSDGSCFHRFHVLAGKDECVQVRVGDRAALHVMGRIPGGLNLKKLESVCQSLAVDWEQRPGVNRQRGVTRSGFSELVLDTASLERMFSSDSREDVSNEEHNALQAVEQVRSYDSYRPPSQGELLHFEAAVVQPLLKLREGQHSKLAYLDRQARPFGYRIQRCGETWVRLDEVEPKSKRWGSLLLNLGRSKPVLLEVPSRAEDGSLAAFALLLREQINARAVLLADSHRLTSPDGSSDFVRLENRGSCFNMLHQAVLGADLEAPWLVLQLQSFLPREGDPWPQGDVLVAPYLENVTHNHVRESLGPLRATLRELGIPMALVDPTELATADYQVGYNLQAKFLDGMTNATFAAFWVSPEFRRSFAIQDESESWVSQIRALGIPYRRASLKGEEAGPGGGSDRELSTLFREYRERRDILVLQELSRMGELECVLEESTRQHVFLIRDQGRIVWAAHLTPSARESALPGMAPFLLGRSAWLRTGEGGSE